MAGSIDAAGTASFVLREDLHLRPAETDPTGRKGVLLEDPLSQRFFRLDAEDAELLRFTGSDDSEKAAERALAYLGRTVTAQQIDALGRFLLQNHLVRATGPQARQQLARHLLAARQRRLTTLVQRYLFVRIPLFRPDRFLTRTLPYVAWLASGPALLGFAVLALSGGLLISRQWDGFIGSFPFFFSLEGLLALGVGITLTKAVHELAHAYTAKAHGCRVPTIGVMLLVFLPLLYTDATDSWRLNRKARLRVGIAGVASELAVASLALALWSFLPDGPFRSVLFTLATATWLFSLLINLNPLLRFDGYYVLSDWLNQPNLHPRSAALAGWWLREKLFAHGLTPPEPPKGWIISFGIAAYFYRLIILTTIALATYAFVFKALGLLLLAIMLTHFVLMPLIKEIGRWRTQIGKHGMTGRGRLSLVVLLLICGLAFVPLPSRISVPALYVADEYRTVFAPVAGRLDRLEAVPGDRVTAGTILAQLNAPDLSNERRKVAQQLEELRFRASISGFEASLLAQSTILETELRTAERRLAALESELARTVLAAPISGIVVDLGPALRLGDWVQEDEALFAIAEAGKGRVIAYVSEAEVRRLDPQGTGKFWPVGGGSPHAVHVIEIGTTALATLDRAVMTSDYGGPIAVRSGERGAVPVEAVFRVELSPVEAPDFTRETRGTVTLFGSPVSVAAQTWRAIQRVLNRELGF